MRAIYGDVQPLPARIMAFGGRVDGEPVGFWGVVFYPNGARVFFADLTDKARAHPVAMHKGALMAIKAAKDMGVRKLMVTRAGMHPKTPEWLRRLGFRMKPNNGDVIYVRDL